MVRLRACLLLTFFIVAVPHAFSIDLTTAFSIGNGGFSKDPLLSELAPVWGFMSGISFKANENISVSGELFRDDLAGNMMNSRLIYTNSYFQISIGPSFAAFNNKDRRLKPGINSSISVRKEGLIGFTASFYTTLGGFSDRESDYVQKRTNLSLDLNIPGALCTFSFNSGFFSRYGTYSSYLSLTKDIESVYKLEADLYKEGIPFDLLISLGYKNNKRLYPTNDAEGRDKASYGHLFFGVGTSIRIGEKLVLRAMIENSLYSLSLSESLPPESIPAYLFKVDTEVVYRF